MDKQKVVVGVVGGLLVLVTVVLFVARTNADVPPEKILEKSLAVLFYGNARNVKAELKLSSPGKEPKNDFLIDVKAQGVLERSGDNKIGFDGIVGLNNHRAGIDLNYSFLLRHLNNGTYLNIKQMPGTAEIKNTLFDKWLILQDNEQGSVPLGAIKEMVIQANNQKIITGVEKLGVEDVSGIKSEKYLIKIDQNKIQEVADAASKNDVNSSVAKSMFGRTALILGNFNVTEFFVWVDSGQHGLNKISIVLAPKNEKLQTSSVSFDLELSPMSGQPPAIDAPQNPQTFSQGRLLWQLVSLGFR